MTSRIEGGPFGDSEVVVLDPTQWLGADVDPHWCSVRVGWSTWLPGASVEGTPEEFLAFAAAVRAREPFRAKRCALGWGKRFTGTAGALVAFLWSPRNSTFAVCVSLEQIEGLAAAIEREAQ